MELEEISPEILEKLNNEGYKYLIQTNLTAEEEIDLACCEDIPVKIIPVKSIEQAEDYVETLDNVITKCELQKFREFASDWKGEQSSYKYYIQKEYI